MAKKQTDGFVPAFIIPETFVPVKLVTPPAAIEHLVSVEYTDAPFGNFARFTDWNGAGATVTDRQRP
ncbi:hypothetical protein [Shinella sp. NM-101]|nr:hypothetical protein [Shinella sp. NM-101]